MKPGDKMYSAFNGELEVVRFVSEGLSDPSCTITTYLVRKDGMFQKSFRCSKDMYKTTEVEAWSECLERYRAALPRLLEKKSEIEASIEQTKKSIEHLSEKIESLKPSQIGAS